MIVLQLKLHIEILAPCDGHGCDKEILHWIGANTNYCSVECMFSPVTRTRVTA